MWTQTRLLAAAALLALAVGCGGTAPDSSTEPTDGKADSTAQISDASVKNFDVTKLEEEGFRPAGRSITEARIEGDTLILDVTYGGGCGEHDFRLHWDGTYLESLPAQVNLTLYHNPNGDFCEALLYDSLEFDLSGFAGEGELLVNLTETDLQLSYGEETGGGSAASEIITGDTTALEAEGFRPDGEGIRAARLDGTTLELDVNYSGGCEEHAFRLHWDGAFMESFPAQVNLTLLHDSNDDFCEAFLGETLTFDLSSLGDGEVIVNFADSDVTVHYGASAEADGPSALHQGDTAELEEAGYAAAGAIINSASIEGDVLTLDVSFGGGCEEHAFELHWDGLILESYPAQVNLSLYHDSNNDFCEAFLHETLTFDLSSLPGGGELYVNLTGSTLNALKYE